MGNYNTYILLMLMSLTSSALAGEGVANQWIAETSDADVIQFNFDSNWQGYRIYDDGEKQANTGQSDGTQYSVEGLREVLAANGDETAWTGREWADDTYAGNVFESELKPPAFSGLLFSGPSPMFYEAAMLASGHIETSKTPKVLNISLKNDSRIELQRRLLSFADARVAKQTNSLADAIDTCGQSFRPTASHIAAEPYPVYPYHMADELAR